MENFQPGDRVFHKTFGLGTVVERESGDIIVVIFPQAGRKRLSLKHAPLTRPTDEQEDALMPGGKAHRKWNSLELDPVRSPDIGIAAKERNSFHRYIIHDI